MQFVPFFLKKHLNFFVKHSKMYFAKLFLKGVIGMATHKLKQRANGHRSWAVRFLLITLALFLFLKAVQLYGQIREKRQTMAEIDSKIQTQMVVNEGLSDQVENASDYLEQGAYEDGYVRPGQQIYQSAAG